MTPTRARSSIRWARSNCGGSKPSAITAPTLPASLAPIEIDYANVRYRYAICYPADLLKPGAESDNGEGILFSCAFGASLRVWGAYNAAGGSLATLAGAVADPPATITYCHPAGTSPMVSGRKGSDIFYAKIRLDQGGTAGTVRSFILTYPAEQAATYDPVTVTLAACLHVLKGGNVP
jgi:hypothetical protein